MIQNARILASRVAPDVRWSLGVIDVRFRGNSGRDADLMRNSANDPERTSETNVLLKAIVELLATHSRVIFLLHLLRFLALIAAQRLAQRWLVQ